VTVLDRLFRSSRGTQVPRIGAETARGPAGCAMRTPVIIATSSSCSVVSVSLSCEQHDTYPVSARTYQTGDMSSDKVVERVVRVPTAGVLLDGDLAIPATEPRGVVLFAHGTGSSRHSPRNRRVAGVFQQSGWATLLLDLLTSQEEQVDLRTRELRFDIAKLANRLTGAADWLAQQRDTAQLPLAVFGASTGAAAALITAAERPERIRLVISRGGRPDLAGDALARVQAPTLLIVGERDPQVRQLNERAAELMRAPVSIEVVPAATHLFEEPGALEAVIDLAVGALERNLD
jgi:putative phosphoribosyl transferase